MRRCPIICILLSILCITSYAQTFIKDNIIWKGRPYASFTSLAYYDGYFYCAFREANKHWDNTGKDCGVIHLLRSKNSKLWKPYHTYRILGHDLRDPQLCITPDNQLMLSAEDVVYVDRIAKYRKTVASFISNNTITDLEDLKFLPDLSWNWLWQPENINGVIGGFLYCPYFAFVTSTDGYTTYSVSSREILQNTPTEASITYFEDKYIAIVRTSRNAMLGTCNKDEKTWIWTELNTPIDCPKLFTSNNKLYVIGRVHYGNDTRLSLMDVSIEDSTTSEIVQIASGADIGYPGVVINKEIIYISYYRSKSNNSNIHLSLMSVSNLNRK